LAFHGVGINGKISELQAAMGLAVLPHIDYIMNERVKIVNQYDKNLVFGKLKTMAIRPSTDWNFSYYPIRLENETQLLLLQSKLNEAAIFPRRYFYPSLNTLPYLNSTTSMPISEHTAATILCLPLYVGLKNEQLETICQIINKTLANI
jgi:dTDP-4-amino-4,6-dideoxygalactose transaminase